MSQHSTIDGQCSWNNALLSHLPTLQSTAPRQSRYASHHAHQHHNSLRKLPTPAASPDQPVAFVQRAGSDHPSGMALATSSSRLLASKVGHLGLHLFTQRPRPRQGHAQTHNFLCCCCCPLLCVCLQVQPQARSRRTAVLTQAYQFDVAVRPYTLRSGDTLKSIAQKRGQSQSAPPFGCFCSTASHSGPLTSS